MSGFGTTTCLSNRPGRNRAGSNTSGRFVAAINITPSLASKPSISTSNWFQVCSRSSFPPQTGAAMSSNSVYFIDKNNAGAFSFPAQTYLLLVAPTPTNISTKSDPDRLQKDVSFTAVALANESFHTWRANQKITLWNFSSQSLKFCGSFKNSTISSNSVFASSMPATSSNVTRPNFSESSFAYFLKPSLFRRHCI